MQHIITSRENSINNLFPLHKDLTSVHAYSPTFDAEGIVRRHSCIYTTCRETPKPGSLFTYDIFSTNKRLFLHSFLLFHTKDVQPHIKEINTPVNNNPRQEEMDETQTQLYLQLLSW